MKYFFDSFHPWKGWLIPAILLILWEILVKTDCISSIFPMPSPSTIIMSGVQKTLSGELVIAITVSTARALTGLIAGGIFGFILGVINGLSDKFYSYTDVTLQMIRNIPHLALVPLVIIWLGIDETSKIFLVALGVFFPVYINTLLGIRTIDSLLLEMGRIYKLTPVRQFFHIIMPGALPSVLTGLRYALGIMWLTLIVAETISASAGLGYMAMQAREFLQIDIVILTIFIYALLGKQADSIVRLLEKHFLAWHPSFQKNKGK